jgi:hypothetical protein
MTRNRFLVTDFTVRGNNLKEFIQIMTMSYHMGSFSDEKIAIEIAARPRAAAAGR